MYDPGHSLPAVAKICPSPSSRVSTDKTSKFPSWQEGKGNWKSKAVFYQQEKAKF